MSTFVRYAAVADPPFESLDFIYTQTADVDATATWYVDVLGGHLDFKVRGMGTTVASITVAANAPRILLAGHLRTRGPILVYRVADYAASVASFAERGLRPTEQLEIPHGPCGVFEADGGQAFAIYELVRPGAADLLRRAIRPVSDIRLVVQGDDLGMCRSVNEGIVLAATEGILTQASVMAPTPWFGEGAAMVQRIGLPVGLHVTLTCEWDYLRWSPLSPAPSLRAADGTFHRTVEAAAAADAADAIAEAHAQADRATALGLDITYIDPHMGISVPAAYTAMCHRFGAKFIYRGIEPHHEWASLIVLSLAPFEDRAAWLAGAPRVDRSGHSLRAVTPGRRFRGAARDHRRDE